MFHLGYCRPWRSDTDARQISSSATAMTSSWRTQKPPVYPISSRAGCATLSGFQTADYTTSTYCTRWTGHRLTFRNAGVEAAEIPARSSCTNIFIRRKSAAATSGPASRTHQMTTFTIESLALGACHGVGRTFMEKAKGKKKSDAAVEGTAGPHACMQCRFSCDSAEMLQCGTNTNILGACLLN